MTEDEIIKGILIREGERLRKYPYFYAVIDLDTGEIVERYTIH